MSFQKTIGRGPDKIHIVKKGESLLSIIKKILGKRPVSLSLVRRLNPGLRDLNRIYPGQRIVLPSYAQADTPLASIPPRQQSGDTPFPYLIKENDSISRILLAELKTGANDRELRPEEPIETYRKILKLNPDMEDMNNLPTGRTLLLPADMIKADAPEYKQPDKEALPAKTHPVLKALLSHIRPVIEGMRGSVNAAGSYFIPLQGTTQISIDCSLIPSVELDDGTTVFLDYENRLNDDVRQLIRQYWHNYYFLKNMEMQSVTGTLQGIIGHARNYRLTRVEKPFVLTTQPEIAVFPDWIITGMKKAPETNYRQGIFLLAPGEPPLPGGVKVFLEQNGIVVTQIAEERTSPSHPSDHLQIVREDLRGLQGIALAERLLTTLGENPLRKAEVAVFRQAESGFNLSITADILLRKGERKLILHSKKLPDQFVKILTNSGFEFLAIGENDKGRPLIESVLRRTGLPASFGYFSSRIPKEGKNSRLDISFSAISSEKDTQRIYLTDFDLPAWVLPTIYNGPKVLVIRY